MNPFDLPGPQFLGLFVVGGFVALLVAVGTKHFLASIGKPPADVRERLRPEQLAYLVGGLERAVEAAVAALHHRGAVIINNGVVEPVDREPQLSPDGVYRGIVDDHELSDLERFVLG
jgi:uncharacterized protein (TIGR04222 family)